MLTPWIAFATVVLVAITFGSFVFRFSRRQWRTTKAGQTVMYLAASIAFIATIILVLRFALVGREYVDLRTVIYIAAFTFVLIPGIMLHMDLSRILKEERIEKENDNVTNS